MGNQALYVGYARLDITPEEPVPRGGMGNYATRISTSIRDRIYTTCTAFSDEQGETALFIKVSGEEVEMMDPVISADDIVYFYSDEGIYAVNGKKAKKIIEDAMFGEEGGYVYIMDEDTLYVARGTRSPKKLVSID